MLKSMLRTALLLAALSAGTAAAAQERHVRAGSLTLAGYEATCGPVGTDIVQIRDIAASYPGRILLDPSVFALPRAQQIFWYMHECGHQIFGLDEAVADCWSVQQGRIAGWLSPAEFERLAREIEHWPGDATHARGGIRVDRMKRCYYP